VIYFASYIVTHVDYDLLLKGIEKIKDVVAAQQAALDAQAVEQVAAIKAERDDRLAKRQAGETEEESSR